MKHKSECWIEKHWLSISVVLVFILCLCIEFRWIQIPCNSVRLAETTNKIMLTLSYSYIASALFYFVQSFYPRRKHQKQMRPYIRQRIWRMFEVIRQCKQMAYPVFSFEKHSESKEEYLQSFEKVDFSQDYPLSHKTYKERFAELQREVREIADNLLASKEFMEEEYFNFVIQVSQSVFLINDLIFNYDNCEEISFQKEEGAAIWDLYELAKDFMDKHH